MSNNNYIERPPRIQPELPEEEITIPDAPEFDREPAQILIQAVLPLLSIFGYILLSIFGQGRNLLFMVPMALSVVATVGLSIYSRRKEQKKLQEVKAAYRDQLIEMRKDMQIQHDLQRRFYLHNYPNPEKLLRIAYEANKHSLKSDMDFQLNTRLWERRPGDSDFGSVRLGLGTRESTVVYKLSQNGDLYNPLVSEANRLIRDSQIVTDVPVDIQLRENGEQGKDDVNARHVVGLVSRSEKDLYSYMHAFLAGFATFHSPTDAQILLLAQDKSREQWRWMAGLPHCQGLSPAGALCFEDQDDREGMQEKNKVYGFLRNLRDTLEDRRYRMQEEGQQKDAVMPFLLLVVDLQQIELQNSVLAELESDPAISLLIDEGDKLGASVLFLVSDSGKVPSDCRAILELTPSPGINGGSGGNSLAFRYAEVGVNVKRIAGKADMLSPVMVMEQFSEHLAPLKIPKRYGADIPRSVEMLDMLGVQTSEELHQKIRDNWEKSRSAEYADWLEGSLGILADGDVRNLKFSAEADGVHGLIAGSTGSGKSELLMTMILGLAYKYDPSIINFVLVDFKGGAAFEPFRNLPHCVDIVTNLKGNAVERMFAAIMAEIHRREAINVSTGSKHIVHYRKNGLHQPPYGNPVSIKGDTFSTAPYPHLFIIIDEFAEMIAENPEYRAQLNSITRLGRALGITLILAAQRPTGVTDQMRANIKFRIALRVENRDESSEVLRKPDAAYLPSGIPGRGYLQVGNENLELIQVAWSGADFVGDTGASKPKVIWHDRPSKKGSGLEPEESPKVFELMVNTMSDIAREVSVPQRKPWPDFLPEVLSLQTPIELSYFSPEGLNIVLDHRSVTEAGNTGAQGDAGRNLSPLNRDISPWLAGEGKWNDLDWENKSMRPVIGLVDNPFNAEQQPLVVDFHRGHAAIFGASGWGKTVFVRTLVTSLAVNHAPDKLHIYLLDFGGRQLSILRELPHVGAFITPDEGERVARLLRLLGGMLENRKRIVSDADFEDVYSYNDSHPTEPLPAVLILVDNFAEFRESFDDYMPHLVSLARESRAYGIHFVVTAESPGALGGKLYSLFTERFALKLSDPSEYSGIVGRGARMVEDIPGRGYLKIGRHPLEFQTALPLGTVIEAAEQDETGKLSELISDMKESVEAKPVENAPAQIHTLADRVLLSKILPDEIKDGSGLNPVIGIEDRNLDIWSLDLAAFGPHCMVLGPPNSGKTTLLRSLILSMGIAYEPKNLSLVLIDYQKRMFNYSGGTTLEDLPQVSAVISDNESLENFVDLLEEECKKLAGSNKSLCIVIDNYDSFVDEASSMRGLFDKLAGLTREFGTDGLHFVIAGSPHISRSMEELRKQIQMPRFGIGLDSEDSVLALNGRIPRSLAAVELPVGRGFVVKSGRTFMLQIAAPYEDDEKQPEILDRWVKMIRDKYPRKKSWLQWEKPNEDGADANGSDNDGDHPEESLPDVDMEALKKQLLENGMTESLVEMMSLADLIKIAEEMEILIPEKGQ